jgi:hypothetical protein
VTISFPGESAEYRTARNRLLEQETELRRVTEAVASVRRSLPSGGVVPNDYVFDGRDASGRSAQIKFSELFEPGKNTLFIYNMMFPRAPNEDLPCPSCTQFLDSFDGVVEHASQRINVAVVVKTELSRALEHAKNRGWRRLGFRALVRRTRSRPRSAAWRLDRPTMEPFRLYARGARQSLVPRPQLRLNNCRGRWIVPRSCPNAGVRRQSVWQKPQDPPLVAVFTVMKSTARLSALVASGMKPAATG